MTYPPHLLPSSERIRGYLIHTLAHMPISVYDSIDSTNTEARRLAESRVSLPYLVVAHAQTAGKGRLGRSFYSPAGSGLYMTLALELLKDSEEYSRVTPAAAVAVCHAIERVCDRRADIKWVNDLYLNGKKICGILTEAVFMGDKTCVLVGIGVNITTKEFPEGMRNPAGAVLADTDAPVDLSLLCAEITQNLLANLSAERAEACLRDYRARLMSVGKRVVCSHNFAPDGTPDPHASTAGILLGVDNDYGLILQTEDGEIEVLRGGEISVTLLG